MADITTAELARLRVPLASLPTFEPVGLRLWAQHTEGGICVGPDPINANWAPLLEGWLVLEDGLGPRVNPYGTAVAGVDLVHSATADRVARWLGPRCSPPIPVTCGVRWRPLGIIANQGGWALHGDSAEYCTFGPGRWVNVPGLAELDPNDDRRLPDGSRYVDRLALALVAIHGAEVTGG